MKTKLRQKLRQKKAGSQKVKKSLTKAVTAALLVLVLILGMAPAKLGALDASGTVVLPDIIIDSFTVTGEPLTQNEAFSLSSLSYRNISGETIQNVTVDFAAAHADIRVASGGTIRRMEDTTPDGSPARDTGMLLEIGGTKPGSVDLVYIGKGLSGRIPLVFKYEVGTDSPREVTLFIALNVQPPGEPAPAPPVDTEKFNPRLTAEVIGANFTDAGRQTEIRIMLRNTDPAYAARNVNLALPENNTSPFTAVAFGAAIPIAELTPNSARELVLIVTTDLYALAGDFRLPLQITYRNAWQDELTANLSLSLTVRNSQTPGLLIVEPGTPVAAAIPGGEFMLPLVVRNQGSLPVNNVRINMKQLSSDGFMLASGSSRISWGRIDGSARMPVTIQLKAGSTLAPGSYPITFNLTYEDARGEESKDEQTLWFPVGEAETSEQALEFVSVTSTRTTVRPGSITSVNVKIRNAGTVEARQVRVSSEVPAASFFPTSQNLFILRSLAPGEVRDLTFNFQAQSEAATGSVPITIKIEAPSGEEKPFELIQAVSVHVQGDAPPEDAGKNVPRIIIQSYSAEPSLVTAGEEFDLHLSFMNTHSARTIRNIKANLTVTEAASETGNVFTPVGASNTLFIDRISPRQSVGRTLRLFTVPDAKTRTYNVTISFKYEDAEGNPFETVETIGIPVYQPARFDTSEPNYMPDFTVGQMMPLSFEMYNLGMNLLRNVKMDVEFLPEGIMDVQPRSQYFGNFDAGHNEYVEVMLNPLMAGAAEGRIIITYESATGEVGEIVKPVSINVIDMPMMEMPGEILGPDGLPLPIGPDGLPIMGEQPPTGIFGQLLARPWIIAIAVLVLIAIAVFVVLRIKKKKADKSIEF